MTAQQLTDANDQYECKEHDRLSCPHGVCEECDPPSCVECGVDNVDDLVYDDDNKPIRCGTFGTP